MDDYNIPVDGWDPSTVNPNASTWDDVLRLGVSRTVDAITRPVQLTDTRPTLSQPATSTRFNTGAPAAQSIAGVPLTLIVGAAIIAAIAYFAFK